MAKKALRHVVKEYNVVSLTMVDYLRSKIPASTPVYCIAGRGIRRGQAKTEQPALQQGLRLVVPGSIDAKRRDYEQVFELLQFAAAANYPIQVSLLGSFYGEYGQSMLRRCQDWSAQHSNLSFYETATVEQPEV